MSTRAGIYVRVSTDDQRDNGHSIDSQLRMLKEHCEKQNYDIIDVYNDAGYSGKDLFRPKMQRLLKDIKSHKIDTLLAIKVDRITRNNYDGFWLLNYCADNDVKLELTLEPYDVSTANGEMIFGMNLVFGQRERKEIGARTKRALEEMALKKIHPAKAPFGYIRNKETGYLEIEPIQAQAVREVFDLCAKRNSTREIARIMKESGRNFKWDRVHDMLINSIYIGKFAFGQYSRKPEDILYVEGYCEPIIDMKTWNITRATLEKNKHPNYGEHIHLFTALVKCPDCNNILSSTLSYKNSGTPKQKDYYFLTCKNQACKFKGLHYNCEKIEQKLLLVLDELTIYMFNNRIEMLTSSSKKSKEIKDIEKAIDKLKIQEKRLVDLYVNSSLDVQTINNKNESIKKEIANLQNKKDTIFPDDNDKECNIELLKKLDRSKEDNPNIFYKNYFMYIWNVLNKKAKKELINRFISSLAIARTGNYDVEITNIKFTEELISKNTNEFLEYLKSISQHNLQFKKIV